MAVDGLALGCGRLDQPAATRLLKLGAGIVLIRGAPAPRTTLLPATLSHENTIEMKRFICFGINGARVGNYKSEI